VAKKAVESTLRKIMNYTAEIIISIFLLVIICLPLAFAVPMWLQHIVLGAPRTSLLFDPVLMFGLDGAFLITLFLGFVSFFLGYLFIARIKSGLETEQVIESEEDAGLEEREDLTEPVEEKATEEPAIEEEVEEEEEEEASSDE